MNVRCTESIEKKMQGKSMTFRAGEEYTANTVNKHWYVVDSIGFETEEFGLHFEVLEEEVITEKEASKAVNEITHRLASYPEPDITPVWLDGEEEKVEEESVSFIGKLKEWYDNWEIIQWSNNGL